MFTTLHMLFETQYTEPAMAIDEIAERIRSLGTHAPWSLAEFAKISKVEEETGHPDANRMIRILVEDQRSIAAVGGRVIEAADAARDQASAYLATRRMDVHQKNAWILQSRLD